MDNKRKDELGSLFVFNNKYSNKEFEKVTIQELVFLIYTIRVFKEKEILKNYDYDTKIITFTKVLINKIKLTKKLYIVCIHSINHIMLRLNQLLMPLLSFLK